MFMKLLSRIFVPLSFTAALAGAVGPSLAAPAAWGRIDSQPRIAVISAFEPEMAKLLVFTKNKRSYRINGLQYTTGTLEGKRVVLFLSGISIVNATLTTQLALDRFRVTHIVYSGIAGGVDPALNIGDVSVPERWSPYLEATFARETTPGSYTLPSWVKDAQPNFGMIHPRPTKVVNPESGTLEPKLWFDVDAAMLATAKKLEKIWLARCTMPAPGPSTDKVADKPAEQPSDQAGQQCLVKNPRVTVGGNGVSGQAFVDNAAFREYTFQTFEARVLDMESAAVGQVAYANRVPYLALRSVSDLAGGGEGENQIKTFMQLASDNAASVTRAFLNAFELPAARPVARTRKK